MKRRALESLLSVATGAGALAVSIMLMFTPIREHQAASGMLLVLGLVSAFTPLWLGHLQPERDEPHLPGLIRIDRRALRAMHRVRNGVLLTVATILVFAALGGRNGIALLVPAAADGALIEYAIVCVIGGVCGLALVVTGCFGIEAVWPVLPSPRISWTFRLWQTYVRKDPDMLELIEREDRRQRAQLGD